MLTIHADSHLDHVPLSLLRYVLARFSDRNEFFRETFELPPDLHTLEDALYGTVCGEEPVRADEVTYKPRRGRAYPSRLVARPTRQTRICAVIAGPHDGMPCVIYTVFGGRISPREVDVPLSEFDDP